jgi:NAD(P)-dependent dehydrogenase (short-subunit alcohol dehydrogenase family)
MRCSAQAESLAAFTRENRILVTGASSGIGRAIALLCNRLGATTIAGGRSREKLEAAKAESAAPEHFCVEPRDLLEDTENLPLWVKSLREKYGRLSGLAPCAGEASVVPLREYDLATARRCYDINVHVPLLLARGFADRRNNAGAGASILFMASAAATADEPGLCVYGAAKGALLTAMRVLAKELGPQRIRVNALAPGIVRTPMGEAFLHFLDDEAREKELAAYPFGLGEPEDVANMAAFLLSAAAKWITGQVVVMDGGRY